MRLGLLEIVLIIAVIIAIAVIARIARSRGSTTSHKESTTPDITEKHPAGKPGRLWGFLNRTGIILVIGGIAAFIAAVSLFRMVLQSYLWAFILIAAGLILLLISRRKK
jgi:membrane protein implicated in regulation of membrane protease activity